MIICIGREFGSGGHEIGKALADALGLSFFDRDLIDAAVSRTTIPQAELEKADEKTHNPWMFRRWYDEHDIELRDLSANDILFRIQSQLILEAAQSGHCVFVGRCADSILQRNGIKRLSLFISAPFEDRTVRKMQLLGLDEKTTRALVRKTDKERKAYYDYYTGGSWGKPYNYDFCVNSSVFGVQQTAQLLAEKLV